MQFVEFYVQLTNPKRENKYIFTVHCVFTICKYNTIRCNFFSNRIFKFYFTADYALIEIKYILISVKLR